MAKVPDKSWEPQTTSTKWWGKRTASHHRSRGVARSSASLRQRSPRYPHIHLRRKCRHSLPRVDKYPCLRIPQPWQTKVTAFLLGTEHSF
uniref:Uncharacterized protein n=1 Tax=Equus asinus TaxID=9793 RepID=A0A9L0JHV2_EQUAS